MSFVASDPCKGEHGGTTQERLAAGYKPHDASGANPHLPALAEFLRDRVDDVDGSHAGYVLLDKEKTTVIAELGFISVCWVRS